MQIQILDEIWCVFFVPPYSKYLSGHLGVCDDLNNVIFVADNLDKEKMQEVYREGTKECKEYIIEDLFHLVGHKTFYQFIKIFNFGKK